MGLGDKTVTRLLIRVGGLDDAGAAAEGGAHCLDMRLADAMRLHASFRAGFSGVLRLSLEGETVSRSVLDLASRLGVDEIAVPYPDLVTAAGASGGRHKLVAILQAEDDLIAPLAGITAHAACVVVVTRHGARLMNIATIARLDAFARACRSLSLPFGLAGGLEAPDVARLLVLQPDLLGFDLAARYDHRVDRAIDAAAVEALHALIPRDSLVARATIAAHRDETDHIFVHDFVALLSIGAYQAERGVRQRVRFSVDADVRRPTEPPTDMRGVFSYDIIIETIRVLAERPHVTFVETLAEELAASLLAYPQLTLVTIKVEKLDVIEGSVGIIIHRDRHSGARA